MKKPAFIIGAAALVCFSVLSTGCGPTLLEINGAMRKVDRAWQLDYQKLEDEYRHRVIDSPFPLVFSQVQKTFLDLSLPVQKADPEKGVIVAENNAPNPLTHEEWQRVVVEENPRLKRLTDSMLFLSDDPSPYVVIVIVKMREVEDKTFVLFDYELDSPTYRAMGVVGTKHAPPLAMKIATTKFWDGLEKNLKKVNAPLPRKRKPDELYAARDAITHIYHPVAASKITTPLPQRQE